MRTSGNQYNLNYIIGQITVDLTELEMELANWKTSEDINRKENI